MTKLSQKIAILFLCFSLMIFSLSCSEGKKKGGSADENQNEPTDNDLNPPEEEEGEPVIFNPALTMSEEGRKEIFSRIPDTALTGWDKITRCEVNGDCTHEEAVKWKILYYFNHPDLDPNFKRAEGESSPCGTSTYQEVKYEISKSADLRNFFDAIRKDMDNRNAAEAPSPPQANLSRALVRNVEATDDLVEIINTLDGNYSFAVYKDDADKNAYRKLNRKKTVPEGREFDIYYVAGDESYANAVEEAVKNPELWETLEKIFEEGINVSKLTEHPRPVIFLVNQPLSGGSLGLAYAGRSPRGGYIVITTNYTMKPKRFVRGRTPEFSISDYKAITVHELYHMTATAFFNKEQYNNSFVEAHPTWLANQFYQGTGTSHLNYKDILYYPDIPFDHPQPIDHGYAISLLWNFLSCRSSDPLAPVKNFNQCLSGGASEETCVTQALEQGGMSAPQTLLQFGESMMNIGLEGAVDMKQCDPDYKPEYLLSGRIPPGAGIIDHLRKMDITPVVVERFSLKAYVLIASFGDSVHNFYKFDLSNVCTKTSMACEVIGFKVDKQERKNFQVLFQRKIVNGESGMVEYKAMETDSEPDVLVFLLVNGNLEKKEGTVERMMGNVTIETSPFSAPVEFSVERREFWGTTRRIVSFRGLADMPGPDFPEKITKYPLIGINFHSWDEEAAGLEPYSFSFLPLKEGGMTWELHSEGTEGMCPWNVIQTITDSSGSLPLSLVAKDVFDLNIHENGRYSFHVRYHENLLIPVAIDQVCGPADQPCCPDRPPGLITGGQRMDPLQVAGIGFWENFQEGTKSLLLVTPDQPEISGTMTLPEPIESEWLYDGDDKFSYGGLMGSYGARNLMGQLVPPIIDDQAVMRGADDGQSDFSWDE